MVGDVSYNGVIEEIIELDFWCQFSIMLFRSDWFHVNVDEYGLTQVNFRRVCYKDLNFIIPSQAHHIFYVQDSMEDDIYYAM